QTRDLRLTSRGVVTSRGTNRRDSVVRGIRSLHRRSEGRWDRAAGSPGSSGRRWSWAMPSRSRPSHTGGSHRGTRSGTWRSWQPSRTSSASSWTPIRSSIWRASRSRSRCWGTWAWMADLAGRVAMVTGGTRGIGLATVRALAAWGATVVLTGRDPETASKRAAAVAADVGAEVAGIGLDVNDEDAVQAAFRRTAKRYGRIDALVAAAGTLEAVPIGMMAREHVERMMATNVSGTLATLRAATQVMTRKRSGSIVLFGSIAGEQGAVGQTAYAAAKSAVAGAARSAARELGRYGIRVNAVAPGVIRTDLTAGQSDEILEVVARRTPLGRLGEPADVARVVRFLVSDEAAFVTGQVLGVDGGLVL